MKQSEARVRIIQEWDRWIVTQAIEQDGPTGKDSLKFFHELQDTGSPLLDFQSRGQDKWRIIHAWLLGADRLFDDWISAAPRIAPSRTDAAGAQETGQDLNCNRPPSCKARAHSSV